MCKEGTELGMGPWRIRGVRGLVLGEELGIELLVGLNGSVRGVEYLEFRGQVEFEDVKGAFQT